jgi:hypothetical protein
VDATISTRAKTEHKSNKRMKENVIKAIRAIWEAEMGLKEGVKFCCISKTALHKFVHEATISAELVT